MAFFKCPDCGYEHDCEKDETATEAKSPTTQEGRKSKGYSLYYVPCRCGCGCGHTCDLIYGPYAKVHNAAGREKLNGELGKQLATMRHASQVIRTEHLAKLHHLDT